MAFLRPASDSAREATLETRALYLRPPQMRDWRAWAELRALSREFLSPWEPTWTSDALTRSAYRRRIRRQLRDGQDDLGYAFFLFRRDDDALLGGMTLSNVQRGAMQSCSVGYWIGRPHARRGHMSEALTGLLGHCFGPLGLHRVEARACRTTSRAGSCWRRRGSAARGTPAPTSRSQANGATICCTRRSRSANHDLGENSGLGACAVEVLMLGDWRAAAGEVGFWPECGHLARPVWDGNP